MKSIFMLILLPTTTLADFGSLDTAPKGNNFPIDTDLNHGFVAQSFWGNGETITSIDIVAARVGGVPTANLRARIFSEVTASSTDLQHTGLWIFEIYASIPASEVPARESAGYATTTFILNTPFKTNPSTFYALVIDTDDHDDGGIHTNPYFDIITTGWGDDHTTDFYTGGTITEQFYDSAFGVPDCTRPGAIRFGSLSCGLYGLSYGSTTDLLFMMRTNESRGAMTCTQNCMSPVLFLPGIMGSRLTDATSEVRWLSEDDTEADFIRMNLDGTSALPDIAAKDAIDTADFQQFYTDVYKSFLAEMKDWQITYHITATTTPYDWRLDYDTVVNNGRKLADGNISYLVAPEAGHDPYILETLKILASSSPTGKVTIIAHSQGGLIAKALMQKMGNAQTAQYIDKVILVATPQLGTPKAVGGLLNGTEIDIPNALTREKARQLAQNFPSAYNLLPSQSYFTHVDDPVITISSSTLHTWSTIYGDTIHSISGMDNFMADTPDLRIQPLYNDLNNPEIVDMAKLLRAHDVHASLDNWTPPEGVQLTTIAGWGMETLSGVHYRRIPDCVVFQADGESCLTYATKVTLDPQHVIDGDGTVVEPSAMWANGAVAPSRYWVDLENYNSDNPLEIGLGYFKKKHANILEVPTLIELIKNMITHRIPPQLDYISTTAPAYTGDKPRLHFTLHSPLTLGFKDTEGNYSGATATSTLSNIPGVTYERYGEVQWLSVPKELAGQLVLQGTGSGSFTLDAEEVNGNDILSTTSFEGIPSATSTIVTMDIVPTQSVTASSTLVIDHNGDGTPDLTLEAKENSVVTLSTQKVPLTVTADNQIVILGSSLLTLTATLSGFQNGDIASSTTTGTPSCATTATSTSAVGTYPIICTIGTLTSEKYDFINFATGTLTILYKWNGFSQPINDTVYNPTQNTSVFKGGSTVPVKFQLKNASGVAVQSSTSPQWLTPQKLNALTATTTELLYTDPASTGTTYNYDTTDKQYHYNWKTKEVTPGYWYRIFAKLDDGTTASVVVGLR